MGGEKGAPALLMMPGGFNSLNTIPAGGGLGLPVAFRLSLAFCVEALTGNSHFLFSVVASLQLSKYL